MIYEEYRDLRGCTGHALFFFYFPANSFKNLDVI